ncbi:hypothetical protein HY501_00880, partial [Candidatus Woesearchaeota archaeon]|nr:hypothetical protein [Candidatus Woesearchaeota archaeon]
LSYGGRLIPDIHVYHYFLSFFNAFFSSDIIFKIIPELLLSALVFGVFSLARLITENENAALLSALISGFVPVFIKETLNTVSVYSLVLILIFFALYCLLHLTEYFEAFIILAVVLPFVHPATFIFSVTLIIYYVLLSLESQKPQANVKEAMLFAVLLSTLISFIIYKKAFLAFGLQAVYKNIPSSLLSDFFKGLNILDVILNIGIIPLLFGIMGYVFGLYMPKRQPLFLLSSFVLSVFILLFLKLIPFNIGLMILGLLLAVMSSIAFERVIDYLEITKFSKFKKHFLIGFIALFMLALFLPTALVANNVIKDTITEGEVRALLWIKQNTPTESVVLADTSEGNYITAIANRKNVADNFFLFAPSRYDEVTETFTTQSLVKAMQIMNKYNVGYFYISQHAMQKNGVEKISYLEYSPECFKEAYNDQNAVVYKFLC